MICCLLCPSFVMQHNSLVLQGEKLNWKTVIQWEIERNSFTKDRYVFHVAMLGCCLLKRKLEVLGTVRSLINGEAWINGLDGKYTLPTVLANRKEFSISTHHFGFLVWFRYKIRQPVTAKTFNSLTSKPFGEYLFRFFARSNLNDTKPLHFFTY